MNKNIRLALMVAGVILAVLVIERRTGIFTRVLGKIPGVNTLLGE